MAREKHDTIETSETPKPPRRTALATPLLGIVLGVVGTVLLYTQLGNIVSAALDGTAGNTTFYVVLFFLGAVLALVAVVIGVVGLVRGGHRILSALSLLIGLVPAAVATAIYVANH
jgi:hypothetical protein